MNEQEQPIGAPPAASGRVDAPGTPAAQVSAVAARLRRLASALGNRDPRAARALDRAGQRIERLAATLRTPRPPSWLGAAGRIVRQLPSMALEGFRMAARRRVKRGLGAANEAPSGSAPHRPLDESRLPRHDGPSGYFSARAEGATKNTTSSSFPPRS
jgi:hypothetical protein